MIEETLLTQIDYYNARAREYDEWFYRQGRYDRGRANNERWFQEIAELQQIVRQLGRCETILELACGTGLWTQELLAIGDKIVALDASSEMLALHREKLKSSRIDYQQQNLFNWEPSCQYDLVFFAFWLSHIPPEYFDAFLQKVYASVCPSGRVFVIDSRANPTSTAINHVWSEAETLYQNRQLNDGREFTIYKVFYERERLTEGFARSGFKIEVQETNNYFIYGCGQKDSSALHEIAH